MVNYPDGRKSNSIKNNENKTSFSNRGLNFENEINQSNEFYRLNNRAIIYKKPTPIKVVKMTNYPGGKHCIEEAYFQTASTTDYNGIYRGKYIDFEAKETRLKKSFPLANIHQHQLEHMFKVIEHGGIGFMLVSFKLLEKSFLLDYSYVKEIYNQKLSSIPLKIFEEKGHEIPTSYLVPIDYLEVVDKIYFK